MIINYKFGFKYKKVIYGFKEKKLYRLPQMIGKRFYPLKEVALRSENVGGSIWKGYLLIGDRKSLKQVESMTVFINETVEKVISNDCPFY